MRGPSGTRFHSLSGPSEKREQRFVVLAIPLAALLGGVAAAFLLRDASPNARPILVVFVVGALVVPCLVWLALQKWIGRLGKRVYYITESALIMRDHAGAESVMPLKDIRAVEVVSGYAPVIRVRAGSGSAALGLALSLRSDQEYEGLLWLLGDLANTEARATFDRTVFDMLALHADAVAHRASVQLEEPRLLREAWRDLSEGRFWMAEYKFSRAAKRGLPVDDMDVRLADLVLRLMCA